MGCCYGTDAVFKMVAVLGDRTTRGFALVHGLAVFFSGQSLAFGILGALDLRIHLLPSQLAHLFRTLGVGKLEESDFREAWWLMMAYEANDGV